MSLECQEKIFHSVGNMLCMHRSINRAPSRTSTAKFSTLPDQVHMQRSPMQMSNCTMLSMLTTSRFAVRNCGEMIVLMILPGPVVGHPCPFSLGLALVSRKVATASKLFDNMYSEILRRSFPLGSKCVPSFGPLSNWPLNRYRPVGRRSRIHNFELASGSDFLPYSVAINMTLPFFV